MLIPKLRFKEFSNDWNFEKIGKFSKCIAGATPNTKIKEFWENGNIPWLSSGEVNKKRIYFTDNYITQLGYNKTSTKLLPKKTVVMALAGQGKTRGLVGITELELCTNQSLCGIVTNNTINSEFLYQRLIIEYDNLRLASSGDGTRGGLNLKIISDYKISFPNIDEQTKIGEFLKLIDFKIELQSNKIETLKLYKKGFTNQIFNDTTGETKKLGQVLCKWNLKNKENKIDYVESVSNKHGFIAQSEQFEDRNVASFDKSNYYIIKKNVFAYNPSRLNVGSLALKADDKVSLVSPLYECFTTNENTQYMLEWFESNKFKYAIKSRFEGGVRNTLTFKNLSEVEMIMPSIEIQSKYAVLFITFNKKMDNEENKLEKLRQLKKGLLQQMFV